MNTISKRSKTITFVLSILILFQNCKAYNWHSVSIEEAAKDGRGVKIKTKENKMLKYKKVIYEKNKFYGLKGKDKRFLIDPNNIKKVRLQNKTASVIKTVAAGVFGLTLIHFLCCFEIGIGGSLSF